jgi:hypothetical protein
MNTTPYTYSVIRYLHDPATGEMLNIGVILNAPAARVIEARLEYRYERLSAAFVDFDGEHYRRTLQQFTQVLDVLRERLSTSTLFDLWDISSNAQSIAKQIWPDMDLSFQIGDVMAGISDDLSDTIESLFHRMVTSQYQRVTQEKRTDDEVWSVYQKPLVRRHVASNLRPTVLTTPEVDVKFAHAFRNEKWHVLQPLSMDLKKRENIQNKAMRWLGSAVALEANAELGTLYVLLGPPSIETNRSAYIKAKNLLHKMPIDHRLIEEDEAEDFADHISAYMREHGIGESE